MCLARAQGIKSTEKLRGAGRGQALLASGQKIYLFKAVSPQFMTVLEAAITNWLVPSCHTTESSVWSLALAQGGIVVIQNNFWTERSYCDNIFVQGTEQHRKQGLGTLIWLLSYPNKRLTLQYTNYSSVVLTLSLLPVCIYFLHAHSSLKITGSKITPSTESFGRAERDGKKSLSFGEKKHRCSKLSWSFQND